MPRANRRRRDQPGLSVERALGGFVRTERYAGHDWSVRSVGGRADERAYLCPGCQQTFSGGLAHVVVWPADGLGGLDDRRHLVA